MKNRICWFWLGILATVYLLVSTAAVAKEDKITVLNPRGTPPPIRLVPMAPRLDTLDGKTIYVVHIGFGLTFLPEVQKVLSEKFPKTKWIYRDKGGSYFDDNPKLWDEIKEKGHGIIMGVGH